MLLFFHPFGKIDFQFDSIDFYNLSGAFVHSCNPLSNHLPASNYRVIESSGSNCHYQANDINTCYDKVAITVPTGKRLTGFRDVESIYQQSNCYPDNDFDMHYKILVR